MEHTHHFFSPYTYPHNSSNLDYHALNSNCLDQTLGSWPLALRSKTRHLFIQILCFFLSFRLLLLRRFTFCTQIIHLFLSKRYKLLSKYHKLSAQLCYHFSHYLIQVALLIKSTNIISINPSFYFLSMLPLEIRCKIFSARSYQRLIKSLSMIVLATALVFSFKTPQNISTKFLPKIL